MRWQRFGVLGWTRVPDVKQSLTMTGHFYGRKRTPHFVRLELMIELRAWRFRPTVYSIGTSIDACGKTFGMYVQMKELLLSEKAEQSLGIAYHIRRNSKRPLQ